MCRCMAVSLTIIPAFSPPQLPSGRLPSNGGNVVGTVDEHAMAAAALNDAAASAICKTVRLPVTNADLKAILQLNPGDGPAVTPRARRPADRREPLAGLAASSPAQPHRATRCPLR